MMQGFYATVQGNVEPLYTHMGLEVCQFFLRSNQHARLPIVGLLVC